jgi:murein L,D-transpeptidase YcbB/YkuD
VAFLAGARYFSHGCIRLEKPVELANEFLPGKIDSDFLEACKKDQKPVNLIIPEPIPVFVVYIPAEYDGIDIRYQKDVYKLIR